MIGYNQTWRIKRPFCERKIFQSRRQETVTRMQFHFFPIEYARVWSTLINLTSFRKETDVFLFLIANRFVIGKSCFEKERIIRELFNSIILDLLSRID